jgi:four helix bundle protein
MALIETFEDMIAWQKARELNKLIYLESNSELFNRDFALKNQIRKSSISIMSNIAEGFERFSSKEFKYFLNVAKGSAGELRAQLYIALDLGYVSEKIFNLCQSIVIEISKILTAFMSKLDNKESKNKRTQL